MGGIGFYLGHVFEPGGTGVGVTTFGESLEGGCFFVGIYGIWGMGNMWGMIESVLAVS